jgi:hypothetical protein
MTDYEPPSDILEVIHAIEFEEALEPGDPRRVDTREARGSQQTLKRLGRKFGLLIDQARFLPPAQKHVLFFGHVGSGKTTELKYYASRMAETGFVFPVEVDVSVVLDRNNLQYADLVMAMADTLVGALVKIGVTPHESAIADLQDWFQEKIAKREDVREFATEVSVGAKAEAGLPLLAKVFAKFSASFKANATYKEELRRVIRNTFSQLAEAFQAFIRGAEEALAQGRGKPAVRVLFIVDGTDKLREEDRRGLFVEDAELLLAIQTLAVYTAPIALKYEGGLVGRLDADLVLPMVKLFDAEGTRCEAGWRAMRDLLLRRADRRLFDVDGDIERLVWACGGHPRELLRLLQLCCEFAEARIDATIVDKAIAHLASEYRRQLEPDDYARLVAVDRAPVDVGNDDRTRRLLYCLALLEYNDGTWRRSHPVIRTLEGYRRAEIATAA